MLSLFSSSASVEKQPRPKPKTKKDEAPRIRPKPKTKEEAFKKHRKTYHIYIADKTNDPNIKKVFLEARDDYEAYLKEEKDLENANNKASKLDVEDTSLDDILFPENSDKELEAKNPPVEPAPVAPVVKPVVTPVAKAVPPASDDVYTFEEFNKDLEPTPVAAPVTQPPVATTPPAPKAAPKKPVLSVAEAQKAYDDIDMLNDPERIKATEEYTAIAAEGINDPKRVKAREERKALHEESINYQEFIKAKAERVALEDETNKGDDWFARYREANDKEKVAFDKFNTPEIKQLFLEADAKLDEATNKSRGPNWEARKNEANNKLYTAIKNSRGPALVARRAAAQKDLDDAKAAEATSTTTSTPVGGNSPVAQPTIDPIAVAKDNLATAQKQFDIEKAKADPEREEDEFTLNLNTEDYYTAERNLDTAQKEYDALVTPPKQNPPKHTAKSFAKDISEGARKNTPEDVEFYNNNKDEIEKELQQLKDATSTPQPTATPTPTPVGGTPSIAQPTTAPTSTLEGGTPYQAPVLEDSITPIIEQMEKEFEEQEIINQANKEKAETLKNVPLGKKTSAYVKKLEAENVKHNADLEKAQHRTSLIVDDEENVTPFTRDDWENSYNKSKDAEESIEGKMDKNAEIIELIKKVSLANVELKKISIQEPDKLRTRRLERASYVNQLAKLGAIDLATKEKLLDSNKEEYEKIESGFRTSVDVDTKPKSEKEDILKKTQEDKKLTKFQESADPITLMEALGETFNRLTGVAYGDKQKGLDGKDKKPLDYTKSFKSLSSLFYGSQEKDAEGKEVKSFDYKGTTVDSKGNKTEQEGTVKANSAEEALAMLNDECGMFVESLITAETGLFGWIGRVRGAEGSRNEMTTEDDNEDLVLQNNANAHALNFNQKKFEESDKDDFNTPYLAKIVEILQAIMAKNAILNATPDIPVEPTAQPTAQPTTANTNSQPEEEPATSINPKKKKKKKKNFPNPTMMAANEGPQQVQMGPNFGPQLPEGPKLPIQMGANAGPQQVQMGANAGPKTPIQMGPNAGPQDPTPTPTTPSSNPTAGMDTGSISKDDNSKNKHDSLVKEYEQADLAFRKFIEANKDKPGFDDTDSDLDREKKRLKANVEAASEKFNAPTQPQKFAKGKNPVQRQGTDNVEGRFTSRDGKIGSKPILVGENESIVTAAGSAANPALIAEMNRTGKPVKNFEKGYTPKVSGSGSGFMSGFAKNFGNSLKSSFKGYFSNAAPKDRKATTFGGKFSSADVLAPLKVFGQELQNTRVGFFAKGLVSLGGAATHAMNSLASFTKSAGGDTFNTLTGSIDLLMGAIGIQLTPLILRISMYIQNMATQIQNGTGVFGGIVTAVTGFINSISNADLKFLISLGMIAGGITALLPVFALLTGALSVVATGISIMMGLFASPILLAVAGIGALVFAFGGFQGIINMICGVLNNYKAILTGVALLFGALAAVWLIANAPLILLAAAIGICVFAVMKAVEGFKNLWKSPGDKAAEKTKAEKDPGIGDKLKNFKMPDMTKMFASIPGGADLAKEMGIDLPKDPTKPEKPKGYLDLNKEEKAKQDEEDKKKVVKTGGGPLTKDEEARNRELTIEKQDVEEKKEWAKKRLAKATAQADPKDLKAGTDKDVNKEKEKIASADETIKNLDSMMTKPQGEKTTNAFEERKAHYATPEGKKEVAEHDYKKKVEARDAMGGQLAMSMKANRAQPAFSSVEEASKKIQISALGVDPLEAKQQLQAEQNLQKQLESYERLNASVQGVTMAVEKQQSK